MKLFINPTYNDWASLVQRPTESFTSIEQSVRAILEEVKTNGDNALFELTEKFDKASLKTLSVSKAEIKQAAKSVSPKLKKAIDAAYKNIYTFHSKQLTKPTKVETMPGVSCWRKQVGIEKVGLYIPGGSAPLFSTVLMLGIPAKLADCKEVILCTPPNKSGQINPAILYAAAKCGIKNIYKVGGAQAIAAMAYGTKSIPKAF